MTSLGRPGGSDSKESAYNAGDLDSIPGLGRSPGEGNGYPLQYSCLENSKDTGACRAIRIQFLRTLSVPKVTFPSFLELLQILDLYRCNQSIVPLRDL